MKPTMTHFFVTGAADEVATGETGDRVRIFGAPLGIEF